MMGKIIFSRENKKTSKGEKTYVKYMHILPKSLMDSLNIEEGDKLVYIGMDGEDLKFRILRG